MNFQQYKDKKLSGNSELKREYLELKELRELNKKIGRSIREARVASELTQQKLAEILKTKQPSIAQIENGSSTVSIKFLLRLSEVLGSELTMSLKKPSKRDVTHTINLSQQNIDSNQRLRGSITSNTKSFVNSK
jgi:transcriptional regulator with XRE-family HTH domain